MIDLGTLGSNFSLAEDASLEARSVVGVSHTASGSLHAFLWRRSLADCDASGSLTIDDFVCFQTLYAIGDPKADCDASGQLDIDDFICFQTAYAIGC